MYVISTNKYLGYRANVVKSGSEITSVGSIAAVWFAENDVEAYEAQKDINGSELSSEVKKLISGTKRYDNYEAMKTAGNDYSAFSTDVWDLSKGYPIWKQLAD